jgi:outer membrane protein assembly factor BamB
MTGKVVWKERGAGRNSAAVAAADGHLYIRWASGTIALVRATPDGYQERGSFQIPGSGDRPSWSHPVIVGGRLYLREGDTILCYDVSMVMLCKTSRCRPQFLHPARRHGCDP